jgi:hypothetical protein
VRKNQLRNEQRDAGNHRAIATHKRERQRHPFVNRPERTAERKRDRSAETDNVQRPNTITQAVKDDSQAIEIGTARLRDRSRLRRSDR